MILLFCNYFLRYKRIPNFKSLENINKKEIGPLRDLNRPMMSYQIGFYVSMSLIFRSFDFYYWVPITDNLQKAINLLINGKFFIFESEMEIGEKGKRQVMIYGILLLGSVSFASMLYSINDARFFNVSLAILIIAITSFMMNVLYLLSESNK